MAETSIHFCLVQLQGHAPCDTYILFNLVFFFTLLKRFVHTNPVVFVKDLLSCCAEFAQLTPLQAMDIKIDKNLIIVKSCLDIQ